MYIKLSRYVERESTVGDVGFMIAIDLEIIKIGYVRYLFDNFDFERFKFDRMRQLIEICRVSPWW